MSARFAILLALVAVAGPGCADTGQERTRVPFFVVGTDVSEPLVAKGDVPVTLERAELAFGPLYLCAGATAGDLCETARLELLETVVVDATSPEPASVGDLSGVTGAVRSYMYDLGISSQLTRSDPYVLDAARELGGVSCVLEGRAVIEPIELPFTIAVPIQQTGDTELGVPVIRKGTTEDFFREVGTDESGLVARFDPTEWIRGIDFRSYVTSGTCDGETAPIVCDAWLERTCEGGAESSSRDCRELGQVCLPGKGCSERLTVETDSEAYRSVRNALVGNGRAAFEWGGL